MKPYKIVNNLDKDDFLTLVNNGCTLFYKDSTQQYFTILNSIGNLVVQTDCNIVELSNTSHALYRLFNLWQIGELL